MTKTNARDKKVSGRPRIIPQKWNKELKEKILENYKKGGSDIVAIDLLDISRESFYHTLRTPEEDLEPEEVEFLHTIRKGNISSQVWWEEMGRKGMIGMIDGWNTGTHVFHMKNRFKKSGYDASWADKQDLEQSIKSEDAVNISFNLKSDNLPKK
jgi:hypothetical protein